MGVRAGGQGCAALEMRVLQEICQLGSLRGDSQIGCSVILLIPCLAAGDYWGGDWPGDPELALWLGHSGIVAVPVPGILGSVWITTTCSRDGDLLLLAEVLWVGFLVFYLIETLSHPLSARSPGNSFHGLEGHRNPRKKDL